MGKPGAIAADALVRSRLTENGIIILDSDGAVCCYSPNGFKGRNGPVMIFVAEIRFAIDKGYGYSTGPLRGWIWIDPGGLDREDRATVNGSLAIYTNISLLSYTLSYGGLRHFPIPGAEYKWIANPDK